MTQSAEAIAIAYLDAVSKKQLDRLETLVARDVRLVGPATTITGMPDLLAAFRRISAIHLKSEIKRIFSDGDEVCVIYDLVTDALGSVPTIEWMRIAGGQIQSINLYYDQVPWLKIREAMEARAKARA